MKALGIAVAAALFIGGGTSVTAFAGTAAVAGGGSACDGHAWVGTGNIAGMPALGRPKGFRPGDTSAVYIWHDCDGWHLRTTDPQEPGNPAHAFIGVATTGGKFSVVNGFKLEKKTDKLTETSDSSFMFSFKTYHLKDGVDWRTTGTTMSFNITATGGSNMDIVVGKNKGHPPSGTFTFVQVTGGTVAPSSGASGGAVAHVAAHVQPAEKRFSLSGQSDRRDSALHLLPLNRQHA